MVLGASLEISRSMPGPDWLVRGGIDVFVTPEGTVSPTLTIGAGMHFR